MMSGFEKSKKKQTRLELIKRYNLPIRRGNIAEDIEDFILRVNEHHESAGSDYSQPETRELCKAVHEMVKRGRRDDVEERYWDSIGRCLKGKRIVWGGDFNLNRNDMMGRLIGMDMELLELGEGAYIYIAEVGGKTEEG